MRAAMGAALSGCSAHAEPDKSLPRPSTLVCRSEPPGGTAPGVVVAVWEGPAIGLADP